MKKLKDRRVMWAFERAVRRYLGERLKADLGIRELGEPLKIGRYRRVYRVRSDRGDCVVKFYHPRRARLARNNLLAQVEFEQAGVKVASILFHDLDQKTFALFGLGCVVYEFIDGRSPPPTALNADLARRVASIMASAHSRTATRWGQHARKPKGEFWEDFMIPLISRRLDPARALGAPFHQVEADRVAAWFEDWRDRPGSGIEGWSLLHWDFSHANLRTTPEGRLVLLDLDKSIHGPFGLELIRLLLRFCLSADQCDSVNDLGSFFSELDETSSEALDDYLNAVPASFAADWAANRDFYLAWGLLQRTSSLCAKAQRLRSTGPTDHSNPSDGRDVENRALAQWRNLLAALAGRPPNEA